MLQPLDVAKMLASYDIGTLQSVVRALHGYVNETAFVQTNQGRFVVRRNHRRHGDDMHRQRHALISWLCERGVPAPPLIPNRDGETLSVFNGRSYEVMICINGTDYSPEEPEQLISIAQTLARYHQAVQGFQKAPDSYDPRYTPQSVLSLTELVMERDVMGDLRDTLVWYDSRAAHLRAHTFDTNYRSLPHLLIHGDIHRDNFLFHENRVVALLDYDQATWDARLVDVADALVAFTTTGLKDHQMMWGMFQGPLDEEQTCEFVRAYASVTPFSHAELSMLPSIIELLWLQGELGRVVSTPEGDPEYHGMVLEQGRWLSGWMADRRERLIARWAKANVGPADDDANDNTPAASPSLSVSASPASPSDSPACSLSDRIIASAA